MRIKRRLKLNLFRFLHQISFKLLGRTLFKWACDSDNIFVSRSEIHGTGVFVGKYIFCWDEIPGNDNEGLKKFLKVNYYIDCVDSEKIKKIDGGKTIKVFTEKKTISIRLNDEKTMAILTIDDVRNHNTTEFYVDEFSKQKYDKLNMYFKIKLNTGKKIAYFEGKEKDKDTHYSLILDGIIIDPTGKLKNLNHCCDPNAHFCNRCLFAHRDIPTGEEIKIDYLATEEFIHDSFKCKCDAKNCRNIIMSPDYLFNWNDIPGNDNDLLKKFLRHNYSIDWIENAKIEKIEDNNCIRASTEKRFLLLKLIDQKSKVKLEIDDYRTDEFISKMENDNQNIYEIPK